MIKLVLFDGSTTYMFPNGEIATPAKIRAQFPAVDVFPHGITSRSKIDGRPDQDTKRGMKLVFTYILYALAIVGLVFSFIKDRKKTKLALMKALKSFENILPQFLSILVIIGLAFAILTPETIQKLLGANSGAWGVLAASLVGSITLIPGFVAFPLAAALLHSGAGYMQIAAFVSTLMCPHSTR